MPSSGAVDVAIGRLWGCATVTQLALSRRTHSGGCAVVFREFAHGTAGVVWPRAFLHSESSMKPFTALLLFLAAGAPACSCGGNLDQFAVIDASLRTPAPLSCIDTTQSNSPFAAVVTTIPDVGITSMDLYVEGSKIHSFRGDPSNSYTWHFDATQFQQSAGIKITLAVIANDGANQKFDFSVSNCAKVRGPGEPICTIVAPSAPPGPARIAGATRWTVEASDSLANLRSITFAINAQAPFAAWDNQVAANGAPITGTAYTADLMKSVADLGLATGPAVFHAKCCNVNGVCNTADLNLQVACAADADCPIGQRCCAHDGTCNPTVASQAQCDCTHPCQTAEGCLPGTCNTQPTQCRVGCFPGTQNQPADHCGPNEYCIDLPDAEKTAQNKGGACATGDNCDVLAQNCPDRPVRRDQPASSNNPVVPYNCMPANDVTSICVPAGAKAEGEINCRDGCDGYSSGIACQRGLICVTAVDNNDVPIGPPTCRHQCSVSAAGSACPSGQSCGQILGIGFIPLNSGACQDPNHP